MLKHNVNVRDDNGRRHVETAFSFRTILLSKKNCKKIIKNTQKIGKIIKKYMKLTKFHWN